MMIAALLLLISFMALHLGVQSILGTGVEVKLDRVYDDNLMSISDEENVLNKQKAVVIKNNLLEFTKDGQDSSVTGHEFKFTIQKYVKAGAKTGLRCFKLVTISKSAGGKMLEQVKIPCVYETPQQPRGSSIRFEAIIFELFPSDVVYVIRGGLCLRRHYDTEEPSNTIKKIDTIMPDFECDKLSGRSQEERVSGYLPGKEPLLDADIALMDQQIVVLLRGLVKNFLIEKSHTTISAKNFQVGIKELLRGNDCIKVVTISRKDLIGIFDVVKISCKVKQPIITNDEDIILNFGNNIYIKDFSTIVFITKNGVCVERKYEFQVERVHHKTDSELNLADCYQLTRWKWDQRNSAAKLNQQPPPKSVSAPGMMWLLAMNSDTTSYMKGESTISTKGSGILFLDSQDFYKGDEDCIRVLTIKLYGVEVERLSGSCGPQEKLYMNTHGIHYGKAFIFKAELATNKFIGLYNVKRDGSCFKIIYDVPGGNPEKLTKTKPQTVTDMDCQSLSQGRSITRMNNSKNVHENKCAALGWFGGFLTKLFSSAWR